MDSDERREHLQKLLEERGVQQASQIVEELSDESLHGALAQVQRYDGEKREGDANLLVWRLRNFNLSAFRPLEERASAGIQPAAPSRPEVTPALIHTVRMGCMTPDGITRDEARGMYRDAAQIRGVSTDSLIDAAMGVGWHHTKPHPAKDADNPRKREDYEAWVAGHPLPSQSFLRKMP